MRTRMRNNVQAQLRSFRDEKQMKLMKSSPQFDYNSMERTFNDQFITLIKVIIHFLMIYIVSI